MAVRKVIALGSLTVLAEQDVYVPCISPFCQFHCVGALPNLNSSFLPNLSRVELVEGTYVYPIGFSIPEETLVPCLPEKYWPIPVSDAKRIHSTAQYEFQFYQESEYRRQYRHAYFGITRKKFGYDCMRHYEIIANGAIPLYVDLDNLPDKAMPFFPREMLRRAWGLLGNRSLESLKGKRLRLRDGEMMNYYKLLSEILTYTRRYLTTKAMAMYLLETVQAWRNESCPKILFLSGRPEPEYQRDMTLHGLKKLCPEVVDVPRVDHMYSPNPRIRPDPMYNDWQKGKRDLYGLGFTYAMSLDFDLGRVDRSDIRSKILRHHFDLVIFGSVYRPHPGAEFWEEVRETYTPQEIVFIDGEDLHLRDPTHLARSGFLFRRELVMEEPVWWKDLRFPQDAAQKLADSKG